jgi:hypothetical protein
MREVRNRRELRLDRRAEDGAVCRRHDTGILVAADRSATKLFSGGVADAVQVSRGFHGMREGNQRLFVVQAGADDVDHVRVMAERGVKTKAEQFVLEVEGLGLLTRPCQ